MTMPEQRAPSPDPRTTADETAAPSAAYGRGGLPPPTSDRWHYDKSGVCDAYDLIDRRIN